MFDKIVNEIRRFWPGALCESSQVAVNKDSNKYSHARSSPSCIAQLARSRSFDQSFVKNQLIHDGETYREIHWMPLHHIRKLTTQQSFSMASDPLHLADIVGYLRQTLAASSLSNSTLEVGIVCGSGLSGLSASIEGPVAVPYASIPHFPRSTVAGHGTELVFGKLGGKTVVAARGRFHFYEGHPTAVLGILPRVFAALGAKMLVVTNAAGGVNTGFNVGDVMVITDHLNLPGMAGVHPLVGVNDARFGPRFPAVTNTYSPALQDTTRAVAERLGCVVAMNNNNDVWCVMCDEHACTLLRKQQKQSQPAAILLLILNTPLPAALPAMQPVVLHAIRRVRHGIRPELRDTSRDRHAAGLGRGRGGNEHSPRGCVGWPSTIMRLVFIYFP